jgi:hypothetical protein
MFSSSLQDGPIKANGREGQVRSLNVAFFIEAEERALSVYAVMISLLLNGTY